MSKGRMEEKEPAKWRTVARELRVAQESRVVQNPREGVLRS